MANLRIEDDTLIVPTSQLVMSGSPCVAWVGFFYFGLMIDD
jgi:hypothetical protein